ncbi:STAS domain-containing protein [Longispora sp. K20-0274]|uniref:STAS domain-containing protein n=1 Tax=Longispora sp. K20-0274 TaxID=3088255 RepID=UPI00399A544B
MTMTCVEQSVRGDVTRLSVFGEVSATDGGTLMHAILQAVACSDRPVVVDLTDADLRDSAIVDVLVAARRAAGVVCQVLTFTGEPSRVHAELRGDADQHHDGPESGFLGPEVSPHPHDGVGGLIPLPDRAAGCGAIRP